MIKEEFVYPAILLDFVIPLNATFLIHTWYISSCRCCIKKESRIVPVHRAGLISLFQIITLPPKGGFIKYLCCGEINKSNTYIVKLSKSGILLSAIDKRERNVFPGYAMSFFLICEEGYFSIYMSFSGLPFNKISISGIFSSCYLLLHLYYLYTPCIAAFLLPSCEKRKRSYFLGK